MEYTKGPLSFEAMADLLIERGMQGNRDLMIQRLKSVNYYRLSAYWYPFRKQDSANPKRRLDVFKSDTCFENVWRRYAFDRRLRLIVMDAIERFEISVRTLLSYYQSNDCGDGFYYTSHPSALPNLTYKERMQFLADISEQTGRSEETFVKHFLGKYGDSHNHMPVWMTTEIMSFGCVLTFYRGMPKEIQKVIADQYGIHQKVLKSWLFSLNMVRNICAHHGRLWNRELGLKPRIPEKAPRWHDPVEIQNNRIFGILTILKHCLDIVASQSQWPIRMRALLDASPHIPTGQMGFPKNWKESPIWKMPEEATAQKDRK